MRTHNFGANQIAGIFLVFRYNNKQWPVFKFLDLLFENKVLGYNRGIFITMVNNSSTMSAVKTRFGT